MFATVLGFTFLSPMMAEKNKQVQQQSSVFLISCHKSLALSLPVLFPQKVFDGQNSQPKRKSHHFYKRMSTVSG